jgi:hypothetical protein
MFGMSANAYSARSVSNVSRARSTASSSGSNTSTSDACSAKCQPPIATANLEYPRAREIRQTLERRDMCPFGIYDARHQTVPLNRPAPGRTPAR